MHTIENNFLSVTVDPTGAELSSIFSKNAQREYLWSGDPAFWGKKSPVLFPIVGTLKDNAYYFKEEKYELSRHGFAREKEFQLLHQTESSVTFMLESDAETFKSFPFHFNFSLAYALEENSLSVTYSVKNTGNEHMYFSVGGHPAFAVPLADGLEYEDHYLLFNKIENTGRWPISKDGLIEINSVPLLADTDKLPLTKELFYKDALVFKDLRSGEVILRSDKDDSSIKFSFEGFPFLGIWAAKDAAFICIEPWCGIADPVNSDQDITHKEGIVTLGKDDQFERTWRIKIN